MGVITDPDPEENPMYKRTAGFILTGILATGAVGAVAMTPASATTSDNPVTSRLAGIKSALSGLVKDGTLTQAQADKVAGTLDTKLPKHGMGGLGGHGGDGGHLRMGLAKNMDAAAKALNMTTDKLRTALKAGKSLADVAKDQKVSVASLVKAMVTATEAEIAAAVKDGTITQAQADTMKSKLTERITDRVNRVRPERGHGKGGHGLGGFRGSEGTPSTPSTGDTSGVTPGASLGTI
jgi:hypothetical protein